MTRVNQLLAKDSVDDLDPARAVLVRAVEYTVPDRTGDGKDEPVTLITRILDMPPRQGKARRGLMRKSS